MLSEEIFFAHVRTWHCKILVCEGQNPFTNAGEVKLETDESADESNQNLDNAETDVDFQDNEPAQPADNEDNQLDVSANEDNQLDDSLAEIFDSSQGEPADNEDNQLDNSLAEIFDPSQGDVSCTSAGDVRTDVDNDALVSTTNMDTSDAASNLLANESVEFDDVSAEMENTRDFQNLTNASLEDESRSQPTELDKLFHSARGQIFSKCLTIALLNESQEEEKPLRAPKRIVYNLPLPKNFRNKSSADFSFQSPETQEQLPLESILSDQRSPNETSIFEPSEAISFDLGKKMYKNFCHICAKQFKTKSEHEAHERTHSLVRPFACSHPNCSATFTRKTHLAVHQRKHTGVRPFACIACPATFTQSNCLRVHMERIHNLVEKKTHPCNLCGKAFSTPVGVKTHKEKKHKFKK